MTSRGPNPPANWQDWLAILSLIVAIVAICYVGRPIN